MSNKGDDHAIKATMVNLYDLPEMRKGGFNIWDHKYICLLAYQL